MIGPGTLSALLASLAEAQKATEECYQYLQTLLGKVSAEKFMPAEMYIEMAEESLANFRQAIGVIANEHE